MPQNGAYENHNLSMKTAHSSYRGAVNLIQVRRKDTGRSYILFLRLVASLGMTGQILCIRHLDSVYDKASRRNPKPHPPQ